MRQCRASILGLVLIGMLPICQAQTIKLLPDASFATGAAPIERRGLPLLWRNSATGENYLYPMDGTTIKAGEGFIRTVPVGAWNVVKN